MSRISTRIISPWFSLFILIFTTVLLTTNVVFSAEQPDLEVFIGEWIRPDGGYVIRISDIKPDGSVDAGYFNPNVINVTEASISEWKGLLKLFIKLDDEGYPGSTYTLYYYAEKDALAGFYYQAAIKQTFEVVFMRK
jgi:hypothetical protein